MSILVKGMAIPDSCFSCPISHPASPMCIGCAITGSIATAPTCEESRMEDCPLVELPPHGRLIDADTFKEYIINGFEENKDLFSDPFEAKAAYDIAIAFCKDVDEQPTVITASEEET